MDSVRLTPPLPNDHEARWKKNQHPSTTRHFHRRVSSTPWGIITPMAASCGWWVVVKKNYLLLKAGIPSVCMMFPGWGYRKSHPNVVGCMCFHPFTIEREAPWIKNQFNTPQPPRTVSGVCLLHPLRIITHRWQRLVSGEWRSITRSDLLLTVQGRRGSVGRRGAGARDAGARGGLVPAAPPALLLQCARRGFPVPEHVSSNGFTGCFTSCWNWKPMVE